MDNNWDQEEEDAANQHDCEAYWDEMSQYE